MDFSTHITFWAGLASAILVGLHLVRTGLYGVRALQAGRPGTMVGIAVTTSLIGLGVAFGTSWLGGTLSFRSLSTLLLPLPVAVVVSLLVAFSVSLAASLAYGRWGAPLVAAWFSGEGTHENG